MYLPSQAFLLLAQPRGGTEGSPLRSPTATTTCGGCRPSVQWAFPRNRGGDLTPPHFRLSGISWIHFPLFKAGFEFLVNVGFEMLDLSSTCSKSHFVLFLFRIH